MHELRVPQILIAENEIFSDLYFLSVAELTLSVGWHLALALAHLSTREGISRPSILKLRLGWNLPIR